MTPHLMSWPHYGARYFTGTRPLPHQGPQRRFACATATPWLLATGWAFYTGFDLVGYALGVPLAIVAALVSTVNVCIPPLIYTTLLPGPRPPNA